MISNTDDINVMILSNLIFNPEYFIKVYHHMSASYFPEGSAYKDLYKIVDSYYTKYEGRPTKLAINLELNSSGLPTDRFDGAKKLLGALNEIKGEDTTVMVAMTEKHVRDVAYYNTITDIVEIYTNEKKPEDQRDKRLPSLESTQDLIAKALAISFENTLGHDYNTGFAERQLAYLEGVMKIPFRLESMNKMTNGGVERKTLNIPIAPTGVGKSMWLCSLATDYMMAGMNVLYITLEMSEMQVSKRIDANVLDISLNNMNQDTLNVDLYMERAHNFMAMPHVGKLRVKEYASREATVNDFSALLDDYRLKEEFVPDIVIVDYLMIIKSSGREKLAEHERLNRLAVELRALAFKYDVAVWSPMQTNRDGNDKSDLSLSDIAGSYDVSHHADFIIMIIETDDGMERRIQKIKSVKNRYGSKDENGSVDLFVTKGKQRYEDMNEFNTSPANVPPTLAMTKPLEISNGVIKQVDSKEPVEKVKPIERTLSFASDMDDDEILKKLESEGGW